MPIPNVIEAQPELGKNSVRPCYQTFASVKFMGWASENWFIIIIWQFIYDQERVRKILDCTNDFQERIYCPLIIPSANFLNYI